jgi:hypothetical protein
MSRRQDRRTLPDNHPLSVGAIANFRSRHRLDAGTYGTMGVGLGILIAAARSMGGSRFPGCEGYTQLSRSRRVLRTAGMGHDDAFPRPRLSARCRFSEGTLAGTRGNGRDAPIPAVRGVAIEPLGSLRVFGRLPVTGVRGCTKAGVRKASREETAGEFAPTLVSIYGEFVAAA